jgi:hypothetical protein
MQFMLRLRWAMLAERQLDYIRDGLDDLPETWAAPSAQGR